MKSSPLKLIKKEILEIFGIADSIGVAIACDDYILRAHRVILSACSSFLENIRCTVTVWFQEIKFSYKTRYCAVGAQSVACEIDKFSFYFISSDTVLSMFHLQRVSVLSLIMEGNDPRTPHCRSWCFSSHFMEDLE